MPALTLLVTGLVAPNLMAQAPPPPPPPTATATPPPPPPGPPTAPPARPDVAPPAHPPGPARQPPPYGYPPPAWSYPPPPGYSAPPYAYPPPPGYGYGLPPPKYRPYHEGGPAPEGYYRDTRVRRGLVIAGAVTFGATYLVSTSVASAEQDSRDASDWAPLFIPVVGPFITVGTAESKSFATFALIMSGLAQSGGLAMFIAGVAAPKDIWVRNDLGRFTVAPIVAGDNGVGLGLIGEM